MLARPWRTCAPLVLLVLLALVVATTASSTEVRAQDTSRRAGAIFLPTPGVPADLSADLSEVLAAGLERGGAAEVVALERFGLMLREEGGGVIESCARDAGCVRRAGRKAGVDFVVVADARRASGGFRLTLTRYSVAVEIVRVLTFDLDEELGQLAESLESARGELLRPEGALLLVDADVADANVRLDGVFLGATPLAPREIVAGEHRITLQAVGYVPFDGPVRCEAATLCRVPVRLQLEPLPVAERPTPTPTPVEPFIGTTPPVRPRKGMSTQRILAWTSVGLAVAAGATGTGFAVGTKQTEDELNAKCDKGTRVCTVSRARAESLREDGELYATLTNVFYGVAGAAAVTAVVLFLTEPDDEPATVEVFPQASAEGVGVGALVRF